MVNRSDSDRPYISIQNPEFTTILQDQADIFLYLLVLSRQTNHIWLYVNFWLQDYKNHGIICIVTKVDLNRRATSGGSNHPGNVFFYLMCLHRVLCRYRVRNSL